MEIETILKNELDEIAIELELKEKFGVTHIRMPESKILASEIASKLESVAILFAHVICGWTAKGAEETGQGLKQLLELTGIHPSLLYARVCQKNDDPEKYDVIDQLEVFAVEKYVKKNTDEEPDEETKNFGGVSPAVQMFYLFVCSECLIPWDNLAILQQWTDDHIIPNTFSENFKIENFAPEALTKFKDFVENIVKTFSTGYNVFISLSQQSNFKMMDYLFKLCDAYMQCTGGRRDIKQELLNAKDETDFSALSHALNVAKDELITYLVGKGAREKHVYPSLQKFFWIFKSEYHKNISIESLPKDENKSTAEFLGNLQQSLQQRSDETNKKYKEESPDLSDSLLQPPSP